MAKKRRLLSEGENTAGPHHRDGHTAHGAHGASRASLSLSRVTGFGERHKKYLLFGLAAVLLLLPLFLAISFRADTYSLPITDQWAKSSVEGMVRNQIAAQVKQQFPNLPASNQQQMVEQEYQKAVAQNEAALQPQIEQTSAYFKSQLQDANGHTYLPDIDTYWYLLRVENLVKNGHTGDEMRAGEPYNSYILAPFGAKSGTDFYSWFVANCFKVVHLFSPPTTPLQVYFAMPLLFAALCVIPAFFIGRREGLLAAFIAALLIAIHPAILSRTGAGFADNDLLQVFFGILLAWFFIEAFETKPGQWLRRAIWLVLLGLGFGFFAITWVWTFMFNVLFLTIIAYCLFLVVRYLLRARSLRGLFADTELRWSGLMLLGFVLTTALFIGLFTQNAFALLGAFSLSVSQSTQMKLAVDATSIWPNVMTTVAELNEPGVGGIVSSVGGSFLFVLAMLGMLFAMLPKDRLKLQDWGLLALGLVVALFLVSSRGTSLSIFWFLATLMVPVLVGGILLLFDERDIDVKYSLFLVFWLAASIFAMTKGVRFVLLLIPPVTLGIAVALGSMYALMKEWLTKSAGFSKLLVAPVLFLLLCVPVYPLVVQANGLGAQQIPIMTDAWWDSLSQIGEKSAPDAIINSWWDFGHWFKYVARRGVTFDGGSQHGQLAHLIGRTLVTPDEKEALGILRMVDCGSDIGVERLQERLPSKDQYEAIMLVKRISMMRHVDARALLLSKGLNGADADIVLNLTHCDPPEDYFITSSDMIGKAGVWGHFGLWDFAKADAYTNFRLVPQADAVPAMERKYGWTEAQASEVYFKMQTFSDQGTINAWISPWPGYLSSSWSGCAPQPGEETLLLCQVGVRLNQQQQGATTVITVLEGLVYNTSAPNNSFLSVGFYDTQGRKLGANTDVKPATIVVVQNGTVRRLDFSDGTFAQAFLLDLDNSRTLIVDPLHAESLFTKLYFLDGKGTVAFQKFSDQSDFMGNRIVVWKVDWSKLKELGLD